MKVCPMKKLFNIVFWFLLRIRYRISVKGFAAVKKRSRQEADRPILFLPNHQALIDPLITMNLLAHSFAPRPLADEEQVAQPLIRYLMKLVNAVLIPDLKTGGKGVREQIFIGLEEVVAGLKEGDNILLYPSGRLCRGRLEVIGANSGAASIAQAVPEARIVLLRIRGLWGSQFSRASGSPSLLKNIKQLILSVLVNGLLFMPRRRVDIELVEPDDFPRSSDKKEINKYLESF
ncbi:MAG: 1-acyl-sn-glycerol-3-phosphate acyltransferase, partial [Candidatus Electrothrix sp. AR3]|nr:1-acyl-sn-glycerol-3-phosphate acyltransferase [Candidatus Electrothrix sp. AR3]